jgi:hypothetical protein
MRHSGSPQAGPESRAAHAGKSLSDLYFWIPGSAARPRDHAMRTGERPVSENRQLSRPERDRPHPPENPYSTTSFG